MSARNAGRQRSSGVAAGGVPARHATQGGV